MKTIELTCSKCGEKFFKQRKEYNRLIRNGRKHFYCCLSHAMSHTMTDEYTRFRIHLINCRKSAKVRKIEFSLSLEYVKDIFDAQNGICPYTRIPMTLNEGLLTDLSLDRINSSKGYVEGNVEWVCRFINWGKNNTSKKEVLEFLSKVYECKADTAGCV